MAKPTAAAAEPILEQNVVEPSRLKDRQASRLTPSGRFAPAVWLARRDGFGPMSSHTFIDESALRWSHDSGCADDPIDGTPVEGTMGGGNGSLYRHRGKERWINGCGHGGRFYTSDEWTPPRGGSGAHGHEGFFLNLSNDIRD